MPVLGQSPQSPVVTMKKNFILSIFLALFGACLLPISAQAETKIWKGDGSNWGGTGNWTPGGVPDSEDDALFDNSSVSSPQFTNEDRTAKSLIWNRTNGDMTITPGNNRATSAVMLTVETLTGTGTSVLTFLSQGKEDGSDGKGNVVGIDITSDLTLNFVLNLGDSTKASTDWGSGVYGISVGGTTTLNSSGVLAISRLTPFIPLAGSPITSGSINLGSLNMNGGTLYLISGTRAAIGTIQGSETTTTVNRLDGATGVIAGDKTAGDLTYGQLVVSGSVNGTYGGTIIDGAVPASSQVRLTKAGSSTQTLTGVNTYTGTTTVSAGTLLIASTGAISNASDVVVGAGGRFINNSATARTGTISLNGSGSGNRATLGGTNTIGVGLTLDNLGDTLAPGNSPGIMPFSESQTWTSFTYEWETNNFTGTTAGTDFDQITIAGTLTLDGSAYAVDIISLTALDERGNVASFSEGNRSWNILTTTDGITGFDSLEWNLLTGNFDSSPSWTGGWSLDMDQTGRSLVLSYSVIPEPGTSLLFGLGIGCLLFLRRRH